MPNTLPEEVSIEFPLIKRVNKTVLLHYQSFFKFLVLKDRANRNPQHTNDFMYVPNDAIHFKYNFDWNLLPHKLYNIIFPTEFSLYFWSYGFLFTLFFNSLISYRKSGLPLTDGILNSVENPPHSFSIEWSVKLFGIAFCFAYLWRHTIYKSFSALFKRQNNVVCEKIETEPPQHFEEDIGVIEQSEQNQLPEEEFSELENSATDERFSESGEETEEESEFQDSEEEGEETDSDSEDVSSSDVEYVDLNKNKFDRRSVYSVRDDLWCELLTISRHRLVFATSHQTDETTRIWAGLYIQKSNSDMFLHSVFGITSILAHRLVTSLISRTGATVILAVPLVFVLQYVEPYLLSFLNFWVLRGILMLLIQSVREMPGSFELLLHILCKQIFWLWVFSFFIEDIESWSLLSLYQLMHFFAIFE